ncbi:MAG: hypothetical protein LQ352_007085 [Teloschistes flavicans]|nr:MAG: hypothetical protein LQ352_007085 [Teloschistes flavicans]
MKFSLLTVTCIVFSITHVIAFPHLNAQALQDQVKQEEQSKHIRERTKRQVGFDPVAQHVSTTGEHVWVAPNIAAGDKRGPCPGLNALANHGYLPHNGLAPATTIVQAVNQAYGMSLEFGQFLAVYGTVFDGDSISLTPGYSIGGPASLGGILSGVGLLRTPSGLSGSHNNYEGDTSATRGDLYVFGNDDQLQIPFFQRYYDALLTNTPAPQQYSALFPFRQSRFNDSIATNPYFFFPQFAGVLVAPAGYAFPPRMMANHSAKYPQGYLDKETFKSFFAVSGTPGQFTYQPGYERIPDNWYKRPIGDEYTIPDFLADVEEFARQDRRLSSVGGNTGTTNSFTGVDITALSKGVFDGATLLEGNNLQCFVFQLIQAEAPGLLTGLYEDITTASKSLTDEINKNLNGLACPQLVGLDQSQYGQFPGYQKSGGAI